MRPLVRVRIPAASREPAVLGIEVYFDPVCPWCYIGKSRLDRAINRMATGSVPLTWRPFLLNPDIPAGGLDRKAYLHWKLGGEEGARLAYEQVTTAAEAEELEFHPERISRTPSTVNAHRLLIWADVEGFEVARLIDGMFRAYFCLGLDISEPSALVTIADDCGMDGAVVERLLMGEQDKDAVMTSNQRARIRGIDSIPCFILGNTYAVHGAQPSEVWEPILRQLVERRGFS